MAIVICAVASYSTISSVNTTDGIDLSKLVTLNLAHAEDSCEDDEMDQCIKTNCEDGGTCEWTCCVTGATDCSPDDPCDC